jgi:hypothetical protein
MSEKVFVSGSISLKTLPCAIEQRLENMIRNNLEILVGDASGVDTLTQKFCRNRNYNNVTVYSIYSTPRFALPDFRLETVEVPETVKSERERQRFKDQAMTSASQYSLVIWNGSSKGSYRNIKRALAEEKKVVVYLSQEGSFLPDNKTNDSEIDYIYRTNNGYSASEVVDELQRTGYDYFNNTRSFNKKLIEIRIIKKEEGVYLPCPEYGKYFFITKHRGKVTGIRFKIEFINWIENWIRENREPRAIDMFSDA